MASPRRQNRPQKARAKGKGHKAAAPRTRPTEAAVAPGVRVAALSDLRQDPRNANSGTERGQELLEHSFRTYGAGRSLVADKHGVLIAGGKSRIAAVAAGLKAFGGSGSTVIACEQLGRQARLVEIDPVYCQLIVDRWEAFTGKKAVQVPRG